MLGIGYHVDVGLMDTVVDAVYSARPQRTASEYLKTSSLKNMLRKEEVNFFLPAQCTFGTFDEKRSVFEHYRKTWAPGTDKCRRT